LLRYCSGITLMWIAIHIRVIPEQYRSNKPVPSLCQACNLGWRPCQWQGAITACLLYKLAVIKHLGDKLGFVAVFGGVSYTLFRTPLGAKIRVFGVIGTD